VGSEGVALGAAGVLESVVKVVVVVVSAPSRYDLGFKILLSKEGAEVNPPVKASKASANEARIRHMQNA